MVPLLNDPLRYTATLACEYQRRRDAVFAALSAVPASRSAGRTAPSTSSWACPSPTAKTSRAGCWTTFRSTARRSWSRRCKGFYVTPGHGANEVRLAFVLDEERLARAVRLLGAGLERYTADRTAAKDTS